jgi:predicted nucleotidyltransferase component of viral defense system
MADVHRIYVHATDPDVFRESLAYSEAATGFNGFQLERDYYSSLILHYLVGTETLIVFKGGTCLSKVYVDFYRLSEDLDFIVPVNADTTRAQRRALMVPIKDMFDNAPKIISGIGLLETLVGHDNSRQYIGSLSYRSVLVEKVEKIKIEIGLREPLLLPSESRTAHTIAVNPFNNLPLFPSFTVNAMSLNEMYAEKFRAAMTRRKPAIRDFFDLHYAVRQGELNIHNPEFLSIIKSKLNMTDDNTVDLSSKRKDELNRQLEGQLKPVLRPKDFNHFDFDEAYTLVCTVAEKLSL